MKKIIVAFIIFKIESYLLKKMATFMCGCKLQHIINIYFKELCYVVRDYNIYFRD